MSVATVEETVYRFAVQLVDVCLDSLAYRVHI